MTTIQIELPDATARAAQEAGLLVPQALERLLTDALRRKQTAEDPLTIADRVAAAGAPPIPTEEINAEVKAARAASLPPPPGARAEPLLESGKAKAGLWKDMPGKFWMASDFDEPLEDFKEYME